MSPFDKLQKVDYNIEYAHVYASEIVNYSEYFQQSADKTKQVIRAYETKGLTYSLAVLIDDYTNEAKSVDISDIRTSLRDAGLEPDYIVLESVMASVAEKLITSLPDKYLKYDNGRTMFLTQLSDPHIDELTPLAKRYKTIFVERVTGRRSSDSHLDSELIRSVQQNRTRSSSSIILSTGEGHTKRYSCPLLAACWHLMRLGLNDFETPIQYASKHSNSMVGQRLISILPVEFLKVEATALELMKLSRSKTISKASRRVEYFFY